MFSLFLSLDENLIPENDHTFNNKLQFLKHVHYLSQRFIKQKQNAKMAIHNFIKFKNTGGYKKGKYFFFQLISFQKFLIFPIWVFLKKAQYFVGAFP